MRKPINCGSSSKRTARLARSVPSVSVSFSGLYVGCASASAPVADIEYLLNYSNITGPRRSIALPMFFLLWLACEGHDHHGIDSFILLVPFNANSFADMPPAATRFNFSVLIPTPCWRRMLDFPVPSGGSANRRDENLSRRKNVIILWSTSTHPESGSNRRMKEHCVQWDKSRTGVLLSSSLMESGSEMKTNRAWHHAYVPIGCCYAIEKSTTMIPYPAFISCILQVRLGQTEADSEAVFGFFT